jgi:hypothetical protein
MPELDPGIHGNRHGHVTARGCRVKPGHFRAEIPQNLIISASYEPSDS